MVLYISFNGANKTSEPARCLTENLQPVFDPRKSHKGRREPTPQSLLTHAMALVSPCTYTIDIYTAIIQQNKLQGNLVGRCLAHRMNLRPWAQSLALQLLTKERNLINNIDKICEVTSALTVGQYE